MIAFTRTPTGQRVETLLESGDPNRLDDYLRQESQQRIEAVGSSPSQYDIFVVRRNRQLGDEVFGPKQLHVGTYSEEILYGAAGSPLARFRSAIQALWNRAARAQIVGPQEVEYGHQTALLWAEIGRLKDFVGTCAAVSEIVAEFRTARFQFLGKDTPVEVLQALARALRLVVEASRFDAALADQVAELLQAGGIDSLAVDALRDGDR